MIDFIFTSQSIDFESVYVDFKWRKILSTNSITLLIISYLYMPISGDKMFYYNIGCFNIVLFPSILFYKTERYLSITKNSPSCQQTPVPKESLARDHSNLFNPDWNALVVYLPNLKPWAKTLCITKTLHRMNTLGALSGKKSLHHYNCKIIIMI